MENLENQIPAMEIEKEILASPEKESKKKSSAKKDAKKDAANESKIKKSLLNKSDKDAIKSKSLYKGGEDLKGDDAKKFRSKIRRELRKFCNQILGKDRNEDERGKSIKSFLKFYKTNWKIQDFKIDSFTQSRDEMDLKDYRNLLEICQKNLAKKGE